MPKRLALPVLLAALFAGAAPAAAQTPPPALPDGPGKDIV